MSDEPKQEAAAQPAKRGGKIVMIAAVLALLGGGAAGVFALGPMLRGGADDAPLFSIENLVINPAGTQGTRFLIVTVALEMKNADATPELTARDPEIRDLLLSLLSARTVEQLSDLGGRDALREEIRVAIEKVLGPDKVVRVFRDALAAGDRSPLQWRGSGTHAAAGCADGAAFGGHAGLRFPPSQPDLEGQAARTRGDARVRGAIDADGPAAHAAGLLAELLLHAGPGRHVRPVALQAKT